ncbi:MAG: twin-arginine translocation signal domain-containing protein [Verrucomicrobia bacterium]|nr:twin-arginine translocation signal domain-containing protein [Verrucomicrobiota bacterium]
MPPSLPPDPDRRGFLKGLAAASSAAALGGCTTGVHGPDAPNPVVLENRRPGTRDWMLTRTRVDPATRWRCPWIEGYVSRLSLRAGEQLSFFVSTRPESDFTLEIFRLGWYGGDGGRRMASLGPFPGRAQPDPPVGPKRRRDCEWTSCTTLRIPRDWLSGVYLGKLTELQGGLQSYVVFLVRDDRRADFLFQCSDHTWQAYNRWPDHFSLYDDGKNEWYWGGGVQVGFNRPYGRYCQIFDAPLSQGSGEFLLWEFPVAYWMEQQGCDLTYISNHDTHADASGLRRARGFLSVGHDEYWTPEMFRNVQGAVRDGVNVAFLSGNTCCGRIAFSPDGAGRPDRLFERTGVFGPPGGTRDFVAMASLAHERPYANELVGAHSTGPVTGGADWTCVQPGHWLFAGTGMRQGDGIPGLVGWEWHGDPAPIPGLEIVASGPTQEAPGKPNGGVFTATVYPGPKGNFVFNAATIWWGDGLSEPPGYLRPQVYTAPQGPDPRVQQITRNLLERMRESGNGPGSDA